ncbi:IS630 family transposase [Candidatus Infernicultor aquiphilus]|uniref:IS630 family transposase n=1 Tax=Candidatus Infernicultor aquiphilus TaxID=1805029 RepID=UPI00267FC992
MTKNEEINIVYKTMKSAKEIRMYKRYQAIYWRLKGKTLFETADIVGVSKRTVDNYWAKYKEGGLEVLKPKKQPGARKRLTDKQEDELVDMILNKTPAGVGFPASFNWTAKIVRDYIKKAYDVKYTIRGMTKVLKRLGLSFTRPTYTLAKADPEKQKKFKEDFKIFKKN